MNILFIYPPSVYLNHSMFKHFTYFAETVNLVANSGYDVSVLDCGIELFDRRTIYRRKAPIKHVVTFTNLKFRLVTPYRSLVIDQ